MNKEPPKTWMQHTMWSMVIAAGDSNSPEQQEALNKLCRTYRPAVMVFAQSHGLSLDDAEDLTQNFFLHLVRDKVLAKISQNKGRFRAFLRASLRNFMANEWHKKMAKKRGGDCQWLSIEAEGTDTHAPMDPAHEDTPSLEYDRKWAETVIQSTWNRLASDYAQRGQAELFEVLKNYVTESDELPSYAITAAQLGMTEDAFKMAVKRVRERFGEKFASEVAETVAFTEDIGEEISYLCEILGQNHR